MRRAVGIAGCTLAAIGFGGCYGSTEPATDVGTTKATLHGKGVANNGPAYTFFEYWRTANPGAKVATGRRNLPAGASGPVDQPVDVLHPATPYSFRLCGGDQANQGPPVCAQTRGFTTATPEGDVATGWASYLNGHVTIAFDAASGPNGEGASGTIYGGFDVTCLRVNGSDATIGGVVRDPPGAYGSVLVWATEDPPDSDAGEIAFEVYDSTAPPDCSAPPASRFRGPAGAIAIYDTPSPTARR